MLINCDIGERGAGSAEDRRLMEVIHIASLACGGHAGTKASVKVFRALAEQHGVRLAAHLSYPDRKNFGRLPMRISMPKLLAALAAQLALLPGVKCVKFHGALYNQVCADAALAEALAGWLKAAGITEILAPDDAALAASARKRGIAVVREAFAERRYEYDKAARRLRLMDRAKPGACLTGLAAAAAQAAEIIERGRVDVSGGGTGPQWRPLPADTICVHSDSPIALPLAVRLRELTAHSGGNSGCTAENLRLLKPGICETVGLPVYGRQDVAVTPGGAMDCFSLRRGNLLLGNPPGAPALEMLVPPEIEFLTSGRFALTGARRAARIIFGGAAREAEHSRAYAVAPGDRLTLGEKQYGLRTYLCFRAGAEADVAVRPAAAAPFSGAGGWADPRGRIRVLPGPEYGRLAEPRLFFENSWRTTLQMDKMGMRLAGEPRLQCAPADMVSGAVADGTVQLTPDGPIILLRHRQTTGGYPRIFNVITADIDLLGQYAPGQLIHFVQVTLEEAREFARQKEKALEKIAGSKLV
ncbi:MAG: LamB/YcsF family protein [Elusimicrobia bacterium]|nr:LamB/YcsF family protein [Elusimicrobiota bacterium]